MPPKKKADNPFNLADKNLEKASSSYEERVWTPEEQEEKLKHCLEVAPDMWTEIQKGCQVRYIHKEKGFKGGGVVLSNPVDKTFNGVVKRCFRLGFSVEGTGPQWWVAYEDVTKFYVKLDILGQITLNVIDDIVKGMNVNLQKIADRAKKQDARIEALEKKIASAQ